MRQVLLQFLEMKDSDPETVRTLLEDDTLIQAIRHGADDSGYSPEAFVQKHLEHSA